MASGVFSISSLTKRIVQTGRLLAVPRYHTPGRPLVMNNSTDLPPHESKVTTHGATVDRRVNTLTLCRLNGNSRRRALMDVYSLPPTSPLTCPLPHSHLSSYTYFSSSPPSDALLSDRLRLIPLSDIGMAPCSATKKHNHLLTTRT
jgi:hypothetical protein